MGSNRNYTQNCFYFGPVGDRLEAPIRVKKLLINLDFQNERNGA